MIILDEPSDVYHKANAYGSSEVRAYIRSARLCCDMMNGACDRKTEALLFGLVSHTYFLEPATFHDRVCLKPAGMSFATTEGKQWRAANARGRVIVTADEHAHLQHMLDRMPDEVRVIFDACQKETTVRTTIDGIPVQCRPDLWDRTGRRKWDLKTIDCIEKIDKAIWQHRYDIQDRFYDRVIDADCGEPTCHSGIIFAEKAPPYRWRIIGLDLDYVALAERDIDDALAGIAARMKSGCWADGGDLFDIASPPEWAANQLAADFDDTDDEEVA